MANDPYGDALRHAATRGGPPTESVIRALIADGVDVDGQDEKGMTALMLAAQHLSLIHI